MATPPEDPQPPPEAAAEANSGGHAPAPNAGRRRTLPHPIPDGVGWGAPPALFDAAAARAVVAETRLRLARATPAGEGELAAELSEIGDRLLRHLEVPKPTPAGERAKWAERLAEACRGIIGEFGLDPDATELTPPRDAMTVLFGRDQLLPFPPVPAGTEAKRRLLETQRASERLLADLLAGGCPNPFVGPLPSQGDLERLSLQSGPKSSVDPCAEAVRSMLTGLAYTARCAEMAAGGYRLATPPNQLLPSDRVFFVGLCKAYVRAFGHHVGVSTASASAGYRRKGPLLRFCMAAACHLAGCAQARIQDPQRRGEAVALLRKWATEPGAVTEQVRDARAVDLRKRVFKRQRR